MKPAYPFACKSLVSAHWLMWDLRIIANTLAKTGPTMIPCNYQIDYPFVQCMYDPNREWFTIALSHNFVKNNQ